MRNRNLVLVINFSGGKDSCAMLCYLCEKYAHLKKFVIFADTGWEHEGAEEWCRKICSMFGLPLHVCRNPNKTFLQMVERRKMFPSPSTRQCTSDLKRNPIATWTGRNVKHPVIINCMGLRAEESPSRKKKKMLTRNKSQSNGKRTIWDYLPIHKWTEQEVYAYLEKHSIPLHPVYSYLKRFSCQVCIYNSITDLQAIKKHNPKAIETISALEQKINFSMRPDGFLKDLL